MARRDTFFLLVPALICGIILFSVLLLDIQLANFQKTYFREVSNETKRNNFLIARTFRQLLEANDLERMQRLLNNRGPEPMIVRIIARGKGPILETPGVPEYLAEHLREPEIREMFRENRKEDVLVRFDPTLKSFMLYHCVHFEVGPQQYLLIMASKCSSMTLLVKQTRLGILILTVMGILLAAALIIHFCFRVRSPLNRLLASMSRIAAGDLEYPIYVPRYGLVREIAHCLGSLTEQLKKQIVSLRDGAREREVILNALTEAILLIDEKGRAVRWNRTACELFFPGTELQEADPPDCPPELLGCIGRSGESGVRMEELRITRCEREYQLLVHAVAFVRDGERFCLISATDLSAIRRLEACRSEFISAISHEMKTPLTGIVGAVEAIDNGALENQEYKERCIRTLKLQSERLHTLLLNFLTLNSLESSGPGAEGLLPVTPTAVVRSAVEVCRPAAEATGIELEIGACSAEEFPGDAQLLQQALNNLISNAILHSGTKRIELSAVREGDRQIDFRVRDWGRGIPEEHRELIFRRFYRVPGGSRNCGGSGIGLAIVKHVALYHRGRVGVEFPPGGGAEFHIVLPV